MKALKQSMAKAVGIVSVRVLTLVGALPAHAYRAEVQQLNWLGEHGEVLIPCSKVGVLRVRPDPEDLQLLADNGGGFINALFAAEGGGDPQWSIQNLYLSYPNVDYMLGSSPAVQFDLGTENGVCVAAAGINVVLSATPLESAPPPELVSSSVSVVDYHAGGRNHGGSGLSSIPFTIGPWIGCSLPSACTPSGLANTRVPSGDLPAVDEGENGCAPGSVARSIKYMMGDDADPAQDIYDELYDDMGTDSEEGTTDQNMLDGKIGYTDSHGLPIRSQLIYWNQIGGDLSSVMDVLGRGGDVEMLISWIPDGGHAAMVKSIVQRDDGSYEITYVDDPTQGDGTAENEEHVITVDGNGDFPGGHVDGFLVEQRTDQ